MTKKNRNTAPAPAPEEVEVLPVVPKQEAPQTPPVPQREVWIVKEGCSLTHKGKIIDAGEEAKPQYFQGEKWFKQLQKTHLERGMVDAPELATADE